MEHTDANEILGETAAAARLGLAARTLALHRQRGDGPPAVQVAARAWAYRVADLDEWQRQRELRRAERRGGAAA